VHLHPTALDCLSYLSEMNTFLSRANAIFAFTLSVLAALTFACFLSTLFLDYRTDVAIKTGRVLVKHVSDYAVSKDKNDLGFITFDITADLRPLFNWNTKQLFVYLTAEYTTTTNKLNQVVLWDKIILRGEDAVLNLKDFNTKYYFWDDGSELKGHENVTLYLSWNVIPNAGSLPFIEGLGLYSFKFPNEYSSSNRI